MVFRCSYFMPSSPDKGTNLLPVRYLSNQFQVWTCLRQATIAFAGPLPLLCCEDQQSQVECLSNQRHHHNTVMPLWGEKNPTNLLLFIFVPSLKCFEVLNDFAWLKHRESSLLYSCDYFLPLSIVFILVKLYPSNNFILIIFLLGVALILLVNYTKLKYDKQKQQKFGRHTQER